MAITEQDTVMSPGSIDGIELTPKVVGLDGPPTFDTVEEERFYRKTHLAGALRTFGRSGSPKASPDTSPSATPSSPTTSGSTRSG